MTSDPPSPDRAAVRHLLSAPVFCGRALADEPPDWARLFALGAASPPSARVLVGVAYELYEARRALSLWELPATLDPPQMTRVAEAMYLGHGRARSAPDVERVAAGPSPGHAAVAHVLASPRLATRVTPHVYPDGFDWYGLLAAAETMSRGQRLLVDIAHDLWTRGDRVGVWEITRGLDASNFVRVVEALSVCRQEVLVAA
jgi:hypothetical protein